MPVALNADTRKEGAEIAIQKMSLIEIVGAMSALDDVLLTCCQSEIFHIDTPKEHLGFVPLREDNPYQENLRLTQEVMSDLAIKSNDATAPEEDTFSLTQEEIFSYLTQVKHEVLEIKKHRSFLRDRLETHQMTLVQVKHLSGFDFRLNEVVGSENTTVRFGKLPVDNYPKLQYFEDRSFFFFDFDHDEHYYWGFYVVPNNEVESIDRIFDSLYYEPIDVSAYAHATPKDAIVALEEQIAIEQQAIASSDAEFKQFRAKHFQQVVSIHRALSRLYEAFSYRKYATAAKNRFCLQGFVPTEQADTFMRACNQTPQIVCEQIEVLPSMKKTPPVKLKNNWFFRPFQMIVTMYGLPHYGRFDPTVFVGMMFVLLFGIMFGDVGQGAGIILAGGLMARYKKLVIGEVLMRCGLSSMFFGLLYGSFFGIEGSFEGFWEMLSLGHLFPLTVLSSDTSMKLLLLSLALGGGLILTAMIINVVLRIRQNESLEAVLSSNGLVGIVFYVGLIALLLLALVAQVALTQLLWLILLLLGALVVMFLKETLIYRAYLREKADQPEGHDLPLSSRESPHQPHTVDTIFEMVEVLLSYGTNTLSFLRVGGFILSHAALMLVVIVFAEMAGGGALSLLVLIGGNLFVMMLEGLLVSIQVLRLIYYEVFSRFYESGGTPYAPIQLQREPPTS